MRLQLSPTLAAPIQPPPNVSSRTHVPIYYFNAALHSDETGSTEAMLEMAYRLAVSEQPMIQRIRQNLVVLINPVSNPDGRDKMVEWFYRYLKGKTDRDTLPRQSPPYWSKYAFVDINRDTHQQTHETTKAVHRMFHEWHPTVVHDLHEGSPFLMTWNGTGPYNPNIDPITYTEFLELSFHEVQAMTAMGMPGVATWDFGEAFAHLYLDSVAMNHNSIGRGYETWGNGTAETLRRTVPPQDSVMQWYRPLPPPAGEVTWSARDNLNYQETAALSVLDYSAGNAKSMLRNFYKKGWDSWQKGLNEPPYAFLIPDGQGDRTRVAQMVGRLIGQHIEVGRAQQEIKLKDGTYPGGHLRGSPRSAVSQLRRRLAHTAALSEGRERTLRRRFVGVARALSSAGDSNSGRSGSLRVSCSTQRATQSRRRSGGCWPGLLIERHRPGGIARGTLSLGHLQHRSCRTRLHRGGVNFPAGSWILPAQDGLTDAVRSTATELGLDFASVAAVPDVPRHTEKAPRIGVWVPWADTDTIGWLRYSLDQRKIPYTYLRDEDIRAGVLRDHVDVLLYGHVDLELAEQIQGLPKAWGPMPFKKTPQTPSFGTPAESDDITGGIGWEGLAQIQHFVEDGGLLVTLGSGSMLALEGGMVRGVRRSSGGVPRSTQGGGADAAAAAQQAGTRTPGAHVRVTFDQPRTSAGLRILGGNLRVPPEFPALRCAAALAAHGLLHHVSRWSRRPQPRRHGMGRQNRSSHL